MLWAPPTTGKLPCTLSWAYYIPSGATDFSAGFIGYVEPGTSNVSHSQAYSAVETPLTWLEASTSSSMWRNYAV